jgi:ankyrin
MLDLDIALCHAVKNGQLKECKTLLGMGACPSSLNLENDTVLIVASAMGHSEIRDLLIARGADLHARDSRGNSALAAAAMAGRLGECRALIAGGALGGAGARGGVGRMHAGEALVLAAQTGHVDVCKLLLDSGIDADAQAYRGVTALGHAVTAKNLPLCALLIERGAQLHAADLMRTVEDGSLDVVAELLRSKKLPADGLRTALTTSITRGHADICDALITRGVRISDSDLIMAARKGQIEVCEVLVRHGASVNGRDDKNRSALHVAAAYGSVAGARFLIDHGADIHAETDKAGWTPLYSAIFNSSANVVEMCRFLIERGADTKPACSKPGDLTPFQFAASRGHAPLVQFFASECGEDPYQRTFGGKTMMELAGSWVGVAEVLRSMMTEHDVAATLDVASDATPTRRSFGLEAI